MKLITFYVPEDLYEIYQNQSKIQLRKTAELMRAALADYSKIHFENKQKMTTLSFNKGVTLKKGAKDFLEDNWRNNYFDGDK